jgi:hypothetical protein
MLKVTSFTSRVAAYTKFYGDRDDRSIAAEIIRSINKEAKKKKTEQVSR